MVETSKIEENWHLLFDIALGYGESLLTQKITYPGFIAFLHSTDFLDSRDGVYLVLIEKLWKLHAVFSPTQSNENLFESGFTSVDEFPVTKLSPSYDFHRREVLKFGVCGFEGFVDIMKVVCVRSWQCKMCSDYYVKIQESLSNSILLSAEDMVSLEDSVKFAAKKVFKWFIPRNLIRRNTKMVLNPTQNSWTLLTNDIVNHVIGSLLDSVLIPLFRRFSTKGLMFQKDYANFIDTFFPSFSVSQRTASTSVFFCKDFFDIYSLLLCSRLETNIPELKAGGAITFASFVEVLLMLGIIEFGDEVQFPHYRSITSKVWFVFKEIYCPGAGNVAMCEDPLFTHRYQSIKPVLSFVFPFVVPWEKVSSVLIGGLNLHPYEGLSVADAEGGLAPGLGSFRLLMRHSEKTEQQEEGKSGREESNTFLKEDSLFFSPELSNEQLPSEKKEQSLQSGTRTPNEVGGTFITATEKKRKSRSSISFDVDHKRTHTSKKKKERQTEILNVAFKALNGTQQESNKRTSLQFDSPIYGMRLCKVFINESCSQVIDHENNHVEVLIPPHLTAPKNFRMSIHLEENVKVIDAMSGQETVVSRLCFSPVQRVRISLRNEDGQTTYSCADVLLQSGVMFEIIPEDYMRILHEAFCHSSGQGSLDAGEEVPLGDLTKICTKLGLLRSGTALVASQVAVKDYFCILRECDRSTLGVQKRATPTLEEIRYPDFVHFEDFVCIVAQLCMRFSGTSATGVPNVVGFLSAGIASRDLPLAEPKSGSLLNRNSKSVHESTVEGSGGSASTPCADDGGKEEIVSETTEERVNLPTIPYNALIEVPYEKALKHKDRTRTECTDTAEFLLQNIRISGTQKLKRSNIVRSLPPFPSEVVVPSIVSQYEGNEAEGLANGIHQVSLQIREEYMLEEIVISSPPN